MIEFLVIHILVIALYPIFPIIEAKPMEKITVLLSQIDPFASHKAENQALKRLDLKIMENFGKWSNLDIQYITTNESLNEVFSTENRFNQFASSIQFL